MAIPIEAARFEELLEAWPPTLDLRVALDEGSLTFVGPEEHRERATRSIVEDFDLLHHELQRRLDLCRACSKRGRGGDGCSLEDAL